MSTMTAALNLAPLDRLAVLMPSAYRRPATDVGAADFVPQCQRRYLLAIWRGVDTIGPRSCSTGPGAIRRANRAYACGPRHPRLSRLQCCLRSSDQSNSFRGFIMLVVDNHRLRGKGQSINDLPVPVQRAAHDWARVWPPSLPSCPLLKSGDRRSGLPGRSPSILWSSRWRATGRRAVRAAARLSAGTSCPGAHATAVRHAHFVAMRSTCEKQAMYPAASAAHADARGRRSSG